MKIKDKEYIDRIENLYDTKFICVTNEKGTNIEFIGYYEVLYQLGKRITNEEDHTNVIELLDKYIEILELVYRINL